MVAAFTLTGAVAANASPPDPTSSDSSTQSCWVDVSTLQSLCVPTGQDLIAAVQDEDGVTIVVPTGTVVGGVTHTAARISAEAFSPAVADAATVVSGIYDDVNYGGGSLFLTAPSAGCSWTLTNLGTFGWNDRASSFKSFAGCRTALYQNINFGGTHIGYSTNVASFGSFNDAASSWRTE
jgi:Peptidase inhibitor family I36